VDRPLDPIASRLHARFTHHRSAYHPRLTDGCVAARSGLRWKSSRRTCRVALRCVVPQDAAPERNAPARRSRCEWTLTLFVAVETVIIPGDRTPRRDRRSRRGLETFRNWDTVCCYCYKHCCASATLFHCYRRKDGRRRSNCVLPLELSAGRRDLHVDCPRVRLNVRQIVINADSLVGKSSFCRSGFYRENEYDVAKRHHEIVNFA